MTIGEAKKAILLWGLLLGLAVLTWFALGGDQSGPGEAAGKNADGVGASVTPSGAAADSLLGRVLPEVRLKDCAGSEVCLSDFRGKLPIVLEFGSFS